MSASRPGLRHAGALLAGFLVVVVLSTGTDAVLHVTAVFGPLGQPMSGALFVLLATAYRLVYAVAGSYIASLLAPDLPMGHALALGDVGREFESRGPDK